MPISKSAFIEDTLSSKRWQLTETVSTTASTQLRGVQLRYFALVVFTREISHPLSDEAIIDVVIVIVVFSSINSSTSTPTVVLIIQLLQVAFNFIDF